MAKKYYSILGVSRMADSATIHSAFRNLARWYHPEYRGQASSPAKFREAVQAYETLMVQRADSSTTAIPR